MHLCIGENLSSNECPRYDIKSSDDEVPGLGNSEYLFIPLLPGPLWPEMVVPDRVLSRGQIELFDIKIVCKQITNVNLNY